MPCPACQSEKFHVKHDDDPYETTEFSLHGGAPVFESATREAPELSSDSEVFCNQCSWHGKLSEVKPSAAGAAKA